MAPRVVNIPGTTRRLKAALCEEAEGNDESFA
jgi:hypothetical protein